MAKRKGNDGAVRAAFESRTRIEPAAPEPPPPDRPAEPTGWEFPDNCPVTPLGKLKSTFFYLDANHQLVDLASDKHGRLNLIALFGARRDFLYVTWPRLDKDRNITGWRPELCAERLMQACAHRGIWNVLGRVRGAGAWIGEDGELVMHCGDKLYFSGKPGDRPPMPSEDLVTADPGYLGYYVYPTHPAIPRPAERPALGGQRGPGEKLLKLLRTWNFKRRFDAELMLGWIALALLGAAPKWRPVVWTTGERGTGKSSLHHLIEQLFTPSAVLTLHDPSQAAVYQLVGHGSLPVAVDEAEAEEDNRRLQQLIKLARWAASGARIARGGADGQPIDFTIKTSFLFTSILVPPLSSQDRSRIAIFELDPLPPGAKEPLLDRAELQQIGRQLRRRLLDQWPRFDATLALYRAALQEKGHSSRMADQWGQFLTAIDLLLADDFPDADTLAGWAQKLRPEALAENEEDAPDHDACIQHLRTSTLDVFRGGKRSSVLSLVREACGAEAEHNSQPAMIEDANESLTLYGLKVVQDARATWLAVANSHAGLQTIYAGSRWGSRSGMVGVWVQAMRRVPGAKRGNLRFNGAGMRCTLVPIEAVIFTGDLPERASVVVGRPPPPEDGPAG